MCKDSSLIPLFLLSDEPIGVSTHDGLGMNQAARVIAETALGAATPFTIGIFGAWGHGKTSLLNAARTLIEPVDDQGNTSRPYPHVVTVQFNAWRYEREEHPIVPLVATIARAVKQRLDHDKTFENAVGEKGKVIGRAIVDGARGLVEGFCLPFGMSGTIGDAFKAVEQGAENRFNEEEPKTKPWIESSLYLSAFDDLAKLHTVAKKSDANQTRQAPIIVVFIDDLDRCRPEAAVEILEGIKLVLAQPGFVFVLALYREVIERYLDSQSEVRYGKEHKHIGAGYIDKIVQLPLWLPSHEGEFEKYIRKLIDTKLSDGLLPVERDLMSPAFVGATALLDAVRGCIPLLARLSDHSPRKLVRKINELLIDDRLLPADAHNTLKCEPDQRRAVLFPLCLIQRALLEIPLPQQMKELIDADEVCTALAEYRKNLTDGKNVDVDVAPLLFRENLKAISQSALARGGGTEGPGSKDPQPAAKAASLPTDPVLNDVDATTADRWLRVTGCLVLEPKRAILLNTAAGRQWLANHAGRRLVATSISTRPVSASSSTAATEQAPAPSDTAPPSSPGRTVQPLPDTPELRQQIALIERLIRQWLKLKGDAPLDAAQRARVEQLNLRDEPITDAGAAWLAHPDTGLNHLTTLNLSYTLIAYSGVKLLARADTGLTNLIMLELAYTEVKDEGVNALANAHSGLMNLATLNLSYTGVTYDGVKALARPATGLNKLTSLWLCGNMVTDAGVKELAHVETGLKKLNMLNLNETRVTDYGVKALARKDTGLKNLTTLWLADTCITDDAVRALADAETGLEELTSIDLYNTAVSDNGIEAMSHSNSGLKKLTSLNLWNTNVTNLGVRSIASANTGLTNLITLNLIGTKVTDEGLKELADPKTGINSLKVLDIQTINASPTTLAALEARFPGIMIIR